MFNRIFSIATFLLLAWSTYELTNKQIYIRAQNTKIIELQHQLKQQQHTISNNAKKQLTQSLDINSTLIETANKIEKLSITIGKLTTKKATTKSIVKPKPVAKPSTKTKQNNAEKNAKDTLSKKLSTVIALHKQGKIEEATIALLSFKGLVWKNRKDQRITKESVLSIISSIDFTIKKWKEKEFEYDLSKVSDKYKALFNSKEAS